MNRITDDTFMKDGKGRVMLRLEHLSFIFRTGDSKIAQKAPQSHCFRPKAILFSNQRGLSRLQAIHDVLNFETITGGFEFSFRKRRDEARCDVPAMHSEGRYFEKQKFALFSCFVGEMKALCERVWRRAVHSKEAIHKCHNFSVVGYVPLPPMQEMHSQILKHSEDFGKRLLLLNYLLPLSFYNFQQIDCRLERKYARLAPNWPGSQKCRHQGRHERNQRGDQGLPILKPLPYSRPIVSDSGRKSPTTTPSRQLQ